MSKFTYIWSLITTYNYPSVSSEMTGLPKQIKNPRPLVGDFVLSIMEPQSYFGFLSRFSARFSLADFVATFFVSFFASFDFAILLKIKN